MMQTADNGMPAAQESIFVGLIRVAYKRFNQSAQLLAVTMCQLAIKANQATFNVRKLIPRRCRHFNVNGIGVCAIQHAYHSIKTIADALIWGQVLVETKETPSIDSFYNLICHSFNEASNGSLILYWDAPILPNDAVFNIIQRIIGQRSSASCEDIRHVKFELNSDFAQVRRRCITRSSFIVRLSPLRNTQSFCDLALRHAAPLPFFLQPRTDLFRKMHFFSSLLFTSAPKCIIVHLTPHEIARICTMPNSSVTEQARRQAREALEKRGQSAKDFAAQHQLNPSTVYAVLSGQSQCRRGEAHRAAVLLGIKEGVIAQ